MQNRLERIDEFVQNTCYPVDGLRVHIRLMLNNVKDIHMVKRFRDLPYLIRPHSTVETAVDCASEQEGHEEEFSRARTLAVMRNRCRWCDCFDDQEIRRCEGLDESRSGWSTAAASPTSSESETIGEYREMSGREEDSTNEGPGGHEGPPASPSTMHIARLW